MAPFSLRRLLVMDPAGAVALDNLDGNERRLLSSRPPKQPGAALAEIRTAVWSPAGQWAALAIDSEDVDGPKQLRLYRTGTDQPSVLAEGVTAFYLCPSPCGRFLSHLSPGPLGLELAVSDIESGELRIIERGQPLYWAWRADSSELAVHVQDRVLRIALDAAGQRTGTGVTQLTDQAGAFLAPWWTPQGSVIIAEGDQLVAYHQDGSRTVVVSADIGRFNVDRQGRRVALIEPIEGLACVVVMDLISGERDIVTAERAAAMLWSPDGGSLAVLVLADPRRLQWLIFNPDGGQAGQVERLEPFRPGVAWMRQVVPFFEQYAHSHATWSPDSTELVAPALDADGSTEAVIQRARPPFTTQHLPGVALAWWAAASPSG